MKSTNNGSIETFVEYHHLEPHLLFDLPSLSSVLRFGQLRSGMGSMVLEFIVMARNVETWLMPLISNFEPSAIPYLDVIATPSNVVIALGAKVDGGLIESARWVVPAYLLLNPESELLDDRVAAIVTHWIVSIGMVGNLHKEYSLPKALQLDADIEASRLPVDPYKPILLGELPAEVMQTNSIMDKVFDALEVPTLNEDTWNRIANDFTPDQD